MGKTFWHFVNQHPTSRQTSHIPNIPNPEHHTAPTSHIPNIPYPEHPTSQTSYILNIPQPEHHKSHIPNIQHPKHSKSPTFQITRISSLLSTNFWIHAKESLNINSTTFNNLRLMGNNRSQIHVLLLYILLIFLGETFKNKQ